MKDQLMGFVNDMNSDKFLELVIPFTTNILVALAIFVVGRWLARRVVAMINAVMTKRKIDQALAEFVASILSVFLSFVVVLISLEQLGINTSSLLALLGAAGLAVGLALKDSLSNFASGVMLILFKPFKIGDFVEAAGIAGVVEKIGVFSTQFRTGDNKEIIVPNSGIYGDVIVNVSAKPTRRVDLVIGIGYDDDIKLARDTMLEIIKADERILPEPDVVIAVDELADSSVNFVVRPWVNSADYWAVKWHLLETIKTTFDEKGISIPYPQQDVHMYNEQA